MLDFSSLSNDQLVELARAICIEAVTRGDAAAQAVNSAMLSEGEKAEIARKVREQVAADAKRAEAEKVAAQTKADIEREANRAKNEAAAKKETDLWALRKRHALMVEALFGKGCTITVWNRDGEKRVYIDRNKLRGSSTPMVRVEYYETGNSYNPPRTLKVSGRAAAENDEERELCKELVNIIAKAWSSLSQMDCNTAAGADVECRPIPDAFAAYRPSELIAKLQGRETTDAPKEEVVA